MTLLLALTLFIIGVIVGHLSAKDFIRSLEIVGISVVAVALAIGIFARNTQKSIVANLYQSAARSVALIENSADAAIGNIRSASLNALLASPDRYLSAASSLASIISAERAAEIELQSDEMWIWAYDLRWDSESAEIKSALLQNLGERRRYRYLIPQDAVVLSRMEDIISKVRGVSDLGELLEVRTRPQEVAFARFGLTLYNPTFKRPSGVAHRSAAVLFPHFASSSGSGRTMILFEGASGKEFEGEFDAIWKNAEPLDLDRILGQFQ